MAVKLKGIITFVICFCRVIGTVGQDRDAVIYRAFYEHRHIRDLSNTDNVYHENMVLLIGSHSSMFVSYDKLTARVSNREYAYREIQNSLADDPVIIKGAKPVIPQEIIKYHNAKKLLIKDYLARDFAYEDTIPETDWKIGEGQRNISGLPCVQATASLKGRIWEVWFTPEIPISTGPWLLRGLPGLIVEARDRTNQISYTLTSLQEGHIADEIIDSESEYKYVGITNEGRALKVKKVDFFRLRESAYKHPTEFLRTQIVAMHKKGGVLDFGVMNRQSWSQPISNPIDLEEPR